MEEEGDVVYFQTSPELELADLDLKRSIYSEINEHSTVGEIDSNQDTDTNNGGICDNRTGAVYWIKDACRKLKRIEFLKHFKNQVQEDVVHLIQSSPLLTEEDHQLLLLNCLPNNLHPQTLSTHLRPNSAPSLLVFPFYVTVLVAILAMLSMGMISSIIAIAIFIPFLVLTVKRIFSKVTKSHDRHVMQYLKHCEQFLSLLSQSIQTIQEREMVYHGFDRPSLGVPVNRLEHHIMLYQCIALRERVFSLCREGVGLVRRRVQSLVTNFPLPLELDTPYCYVSLRELSELHDHLGDQSLLGYQLLLGDGKPPHLSLQSLKTASSLFAVTNSELLKRVALSMRTDQCVSFKREVNDAISLLSRFVLDGAEQLQWSIDYHRRPTVSSQATPSPSTDSTHIDKVPSFMNTELHSSDVQILTALNKVRELQSDVSEASEDVKDEINAILNNLYSAERHLRIIIDHLSHKNVKDQCCKDDSEDDNEVSTCRYPSLLPATPEEDSSSSEDERVYEGIVTVRDEMESHDSHVTQQDEYTKSQRETCIKMLHELNSVLAVRRVERLKKSKKKKSKKCLENEAKSSAPSNTSGLEQQSPIDCRENSLIDNKPDSHSSGMGMRIVAQNLRHNKPLTDHTTIADTVTTTPGIKMEGMNLMAFAAASRANVKQEQVYGEEDDSN